MSHQNIDEWKRFEALGDRTVQQLVEPPNSEQEKLCELCGGTGWRNENGNSKAVGRCSCYEVQISRAFVRETGIPVRWFRDMTVRGMRFPSPAYERTVEQIASWLLQYPKSKSSQGILLTGGAGTGKTRLLSACLRYLILRHHIKCRYFDQRDFLHQIRSTYEANHLVSERETIGWFMDPKVVVLDELFQPRTDWEQDMMMHLVGERYKQDKTLLFGTNLPAAEIEEELDDRLVSRMIEMAVWYKLEASDFRKVEKEKP